MMICKKMKILNFILYAIIPFIIGFYIGWGNIYSLYNTRIVVPLSASSSFYEKKKIVEKGDTTCYVAVRDSIRKNYPLCGTYFYYSVIMSTVYDYVPANYDAYKAIADAERFLKKAKKGSPITSPIALFFLRRGAEKGDKKCVEALIQNK